MQDGIEYLTWTFLFRRILKNPTYYQLEDVKAGTINKYLRDMLRTVLWDLNDAGCLEFGDENQDTFESTVCGQIASYYYMSYKTMAIFKQSLKSDCTINELIRILSSTTEYDELPVRHNEDKLNFELSKEVPLKVDDLAMDEPSTKAMLLFQAHFSRLQLPITDYVTDLRSVLDQSIRILQAMIDYTSSADHLWLKCTLKLINLIQMITQGRWLNDSTLSNLPGITEQSVINFWENGIETLPELLVCPYDKTRNILRQDEELADEDIDDIMKCIRYKYPRIDVQITLSSFDIGLDSDLMVLCRLKRYSGNPNKIYSPKWYKPKLEGWIIVISLHNSEKLLAVKRVRISRQWKTTRIKIHTPSNVEEIPDYNEEEKTLLLDVYIMSDAYLGLDQFYTVSCNLDIYQQRKQIGGPQRSKFDQAKRRFSKRYQDDDVSSIATSTAFSSRLTNMNDNNDEKVVESKQDDPFFNLETADDLLDLKAAISGSSGSGSGGNDTAEYEEEMKQSQLEYRSYAQSAGGQSRGGQSGITYISGVHGQSGQVYDDVTVLSGATFDTQLLDPRNRPQIDDRASTIQIDFDDLRSVVTDITDDDAQSILTQQTIIKKWD